MPNYGLLRCTSYAIQYYLNKSYGPETRFIGDSGLEIGLTADRIPYYGFLFPNYGKKLATQSN